MRFIFSPRHFATLVEYFDDNGIEHILWAKKEAYEWRHLEPDRAGYVRRMKALHADPVKLTWKRFEFLLMILATCGNVKVKHVKLKKPTKDFNIIPLIAFVPDKVLEKDWENFNKRWLIE